MTNAPPFCLLLIDDDPKYLAHVTSLLGGEYELHTASSGSEGVASFSRLAARRPLVICDLKLPDMSGFSVCKAIKELGQAYVMMLTAHNDDKLRVSCLEARADHYLNKTINDEELKLLIRNICNTLRAQSTGESGSVQPELSNGSANKVVSLEDQVKLFILSCYAVHNVRQQAYDCTSKLLAKKLNKSHRTFQREIKAECGLSFQQLHLLIRLEHAKSLFDCGYSVSQAADLLEFSSPSHLSRSFKGHFGFTPSEYRTS